MLQFIRKVRLTAKGAGGLSINAGARGLHELKISFDISRDLSGDANDALIEVWNLSEGHRNAMGRELDDIVLEAGYTPPGGGDNTGIIFAGQIRDVEHRRQGADIVTRLECGDGDRALRRATISKTFPAGTPVTDVLTEIQSELEKEGVSLGEWALPEMRVPKRPYSMCGSCRRELDRLGRAHGFYWSIQNGVMEIVPGNGYAGQMISLSPRSGLIGTPTLTDNGIKVQALLNPGVRPGRRVKVESELLEMNAEGGVYRVSQATFRGDNTDGQFAVEIHGEAVRGGKVDEGKRR